MKIFQLVAAVLIFGSGIGVCRANLGETETQCIARYGPESDVQTDIGYKQVGDKAASFTVKTATGSLSVRVIFLNGMSCRETLANADQSTGLSKDQMMGILNSQSAGLKWDKRNTIYRTSNGQTYGTIDWLRSDGATARFWVSSHAGSQTQTGQVDVATKQYTYAQRIFDKENGGG
jgi:hypothetical protein